MPMRSPHSRAKALELELELELDEEEEEEEELEEERGGEEEEEQEQGVCGKRRVPSFSFGPDGVLSAAQTAHPMRSICLFLSEVQ